jgi:outer membrane lipoprotein-sorting protein
MALVVVLAVLWVPGVWAQDTVESVQKAVIEQWNKLNSASGTFTLAGEYKMSKDATGALKFAGGGSFNHLKKGETSLFIMNAWAGMTEAAKLAQVQGYYDGKDLYGDVSVPLAKVFESGKVDPSEFSGAPGAKALLDLAQKHLNLTVAPAEKVGDKDCYVLEGTFKDQDEKNPVGKLKICLAKDTGILARVGIISKEGAEMGAITMADVKVNPPLGEDVFKYVPLPPPAPPKPPDATQPAANAPATDAAKAPAATAPAAPAPKAPAEKGKK